MEKSPVNLSGEHPDTAIKHGIPCSKRGCSGRSHFHGVVLYFLTRILSNMCFDFRIIGVA